MRGGSDLHRLLFSVHRTRLPDPAASHVCEYETRFLRPRQIPSNVTHPILPAAKPSKTDGHSFSRREFLATAGAAIALGAAAHATGQPIASERRSSPFKKAFMISRLSRPAKPMTVMDNFRTVRDAGFAGMEVGGSMNQREVLAARDATGLAIPSVVVATHWTKPLSDPNPEARRVGLEGLLQALRDAKVYGADSVLLVPAVVNQQVSYADAHTRSVEAITKALPLAESLGVAIAIENVFNYFLLSPLEAAQYVDSFHSPMVRFHLDVGNVAAWGWAEHWIRALGKRIAKIHVKEYSRELRNTRGPHAGFQVDLGDGDNDWPAILTALRNVGYNGWMIAEQFRPEGFEDAAWLKHLSARMDRVLAG